MPEILLVYDKSEDAGPTLEYELVRAFQEKGLSANITTSLNEDNAKQHLPGNVSLVIAFLQIPKSPVTKLSQDEEEGLELLCWMNNSQINTSSILVAPTRTKKLQDSQGKVGNCSVVLSGKDMIQDVVKQAVELIEKAPTRCLEVDIDLSGRTKWTYSLTGKGFNFSKPFGELSIDETTILELSTFSDAMASTDNWQEVLRTIGDKLLSALGRDPSFIGDVREGLAYAGDETHTRVRFVVKPDLHSLALEAVLCPRARDQYWMLSAPIYRRLWTNAPTTGGFLFEGGQKIHCLIIDATTSGLFQEKDQQTYLNEIPNVSKECDWIETYLNQKRNELNIGDVRLLRARPGEPPLAQQVKEALESHDWGIVHYGGHSHHDAKNDVGYVFFPGSGAGSVEKVDLQRFGDWLRRVTFTYFSSCDSSAGPFVFELANRRVSNILGFRWKIDDPLAFEYAKEFYQTLFESRSLEKAFLKARQQMHDLHPADRIWAAPILIKQLSDS